MNRVAGKFWPSPLIEMPPNLVIGGRNGAGEFLPSPLLEMPTVIGVRISGQGCADLDILVRETQ